MATLWGALAASGVGEVREDGEWRSIAKSIANRKTRCFWSEVLSLTRRIDAAGLAQFDAHDLEVRRFGRSRPGKLGFISNDSRRTPGQLAAPTSARDLP